MLLILTYIQVFVQSEMNSMACNKAWANKRGVDIPEENISLEGEIRVASLGNLPYGYPQEV